MKGSIASGKGLGSYIQLYCQNPHSFLRTKKEDSTINLKIYNFHPHQYELTPGT